MHLVYFLLFMLNLARATPVPLDDSSPESYFKFPDDDSFPVIDGPTLDFGDENPEAPKKHEKRFPVPPFYLPYTGWQVTFERRLGDRFDFKKDFWIYIFPGVADQKNPLDGQPVDIVVAPGRGGPKALVSGLASNGELWYSSNSYFAPLLDMRKGLPNVNRTFIEFASAFKRPTGWQFYIHQGWDPASAPTNNKHALFNINTHTTLPSKGYINLIFKNTTVNGSVYFDSQPPWWPETYLANITGTLAKQGKMWV